MIAGRKATHCIRLTGRAFAFLLTLAGISGALHAQQMCEVKLATCPENLRNATLNVPDYATHLSASIKACNLVNVIEGPGQAGAPPSIVFIIDNSGSMHGSGGSDPNAARFTVTSAVLDSIYKLQPNAEVGLVVYTNLLFFDKQNSDTTYNAFLRVLPQDPNGEPNEAYLPPLILNKSYNGRLGIDIIKGLLATSGGGGGGTDLVYRATSFSPTQYTDINIAMIAAKAAIASATNPKERQFVILLSDGEPQGDVQAGLPPNDFTNGANMPTTFTVFFTSGATTGSTLINTMTTNILNNGYSVSNPYSAVWNMQANYQSLLTMLMNNIISTIKKLSYAIPTSMTVNGTYVTTRYNTADSSFVFSQRFALNLGLSSYQMIIHYLLTDVTTSQQKDTADTINFSVNRAAGVQVSPDVIIDCGQPAIGIYYRGQAVSLVTQYMDTLEVRVTVGTAQISQLTAVVKNALTPLDSLQLPLTNSQSGWEAPFVGVIAATATAGDRILQHRAQDSIVATSPDPTNPGHVLRVSVPFVFSKIIMVTGAAYYDNNADGFIDSIFVGLDTSVTSDDAAAIANLITLPPQRGFTRLSVAAVPEGIAIRVKEGSSVPNTATNASDTLAVRSGPLSGNGSLQAGGVAIADKLAPVILDAILLPSTKGIDTIAFTFSEPVKDVTFNQPFMFRTPRGGSYQLTLSQVHLNAALDTFYIVSADSIPAAGDSVWINPGGHVSDLSGMTQDNPANRRALLHVKALPYRIVAHVANNPYVRGQTVPPVILGIPGATVACHDCATSGGMIIGVDLPGLLVKPPGMRATVSVYDVMMNPVIKDVPMAFTSDSKKLFMVWDATNSNGRKVGSGTYVAEIRIDEGNGTVKNERMHIGVKR